MLKSKEQKEQQLSELAEIKEDIFELKNQLQTFNPRDTLESMERRLHNIERYLMKVSSYIVTSVQESQENRENQDGREVAGQMPDKSENKKIPADLPPLERFNIWAENSISFELPDDFKFCRIDNIQIKSPLDIKSGDSGSLWVVYFGENQYYILPNPLAVNSGNYTECEAMYNISGQANIAYPPTSLFVEEPCLLNTEESRLMIHKRGKIRIL